MQISSTPLCSTQNTKQSGSSLQWFSHGHCFTLSSVCGKDKLDGDIMGTQYGNSCFRNNLMCGSSCPKMVFCFQLQMQKGPLDWNRGSYYWIECGANVLEPHISSHRHILLKELLLFLELFGSSFGVSYSWLQNAEEAKEYIFLGERCLFLTNAYWS